MNVTEARANLRILDALVTERGALKDERTGALEAFDVEHSAELLKALDENHARHAAILQWFEDHPHKEATPLNF